MQIAVELLTTIFAILSGLYFFKSLSGFYKALLLQAFIYLILDLCAAYKLGDGIFDNLVFFNISIFLEMFILALATQYKPVIKYSKYLVVLSITLFFAVYSLCAFYLTGINAFMLYAAIAQGILLSALYLWLIYGNSFNRKEKTFNWPLIIASSGIILYFAATAPYFFFGNYLQKVNPVVNKELFEIIVLKLGQFRYLLLAISFIWLGLSNKHLQSNAHQ